MAGERLPARFSLRSQLWFRWTGKCLETATSHMQTVVRHFRMTFKPTILNVATGMFIIGCFLHATFNYGQLSEGEGWGVVAMIGLLGVGIVLLAIDFIIQQIFKNRKTVNIICGLVTIAATLLLLFK